MWRHQAAVARLPRPPIGAALGAHLARPRARGPALEGTRRWQWYEPPGTGTTGGRRNSRCPPPTVPPTSGRGARPLVAMSPARSPTRSSEDARATASACGRSGVRDAPHPQPPALGHPHSRARSTVIGCETWHTTEAVTGDAERPYPSTGVVTMRSRGAAAQEATGPRLNSAETEAAPPWGEPATSMRSRKSWRAGVGRGRRAEGQGGTSTNGTQGEPRVGGP